MPSCHSLPTHVPVLIAGGGPVGLTVAALLARYRIRCLLIEADEGRCEGSRAICISRRSQEILAWCGADEPVRRKGLGWAAGRSFFRDTEVLRFAMPSEPTERFAPMVNIQQYYIEEYLLAALAREYCTVQQGARVSEVRDCASGVEVRIASGRTCARVQADWLIACDGGRSTVREQLGLRLEGTEYEGRYVIVDIEQRSARAVERLAWFDPPSNPGSTILMHRQPDDIWRIDYQLQDGEDAEQAASPHRVLPRVQAHLDMIGETAPWKPLWISTYTAKCLSLRSYRSGHVLFAGDAAHLVPIFGVRGLNSGLDDAGNLAWKLALVLRAGAAPALLDSYSSERVAAAEENIAYGRKSTEFMAPPHAGFALMRAAALRLALLVPQVRELINPRQSLPVEYRGSPLNLGQQGTFSAAARPGMPAPEARLRGRQGHVHLSSLFGVSFSALLFTDRAFSVAPSACAAKGPGGVAPLLRLFHIRRHCEPGPEDLHDELGQAWDRYDAAEGSLYLIRPDGYVMGRWRDAACESESLQSRLERALREIS